MAEDDSVSSNNIRRMRWLIGGGLSLLLLAGTVAVADAVRNEVAPTIAPGQVDDMRAALDKQLPSASRSQRAALADGVVDRSEIEALGENASACSVANGSSRIRLNIGKKSVGFSLTFDPDADVDALSEIAEKCWSEHIGLAERYYGLQNVLPVNEQVRINELVVECLADAGYEAPGWPATDAKVDPAVEAECADRAESS